MSCGTFRVEAASTILPTERHVSVLAARIATQEHDSCTSAPISLEGLLSCKVDHKKASGL